MLDETAIRADYLQGLANLRSGKDLDGPDKGMFWLIPFAVAAGRAGGAYGQHLDWPAYESLSAGERKAVEMIRTCLSTSRSALIDYGALDPVYYQFCYALFSINETLGKRRGRKELPRSALDHKERDIHTALYESPSYCAVALVELINKFGLDAQGNPKGDEDGAESL